MIYFETVVTLIVNTMRRIATNCDDVAKRSACRLLATYSHERRYRECLNFASTRVSHRGRPMAGAQQESAVPTAEKRFGNTRN